MKSTKRLLITALAFFLCFVSSKAWSQDCMNSLEKISQYSEANYLKENIYLKFTTQIIENGKGGEKLESEIWLHQEKYMYSNAFITVIQDDRTQVTILKDQRTIILKAVPPEALNKKKQVVPAAMQIDSLKNIITNIQCIRQTSTERVLLDFPQNVGGKKNLIKRIMLDYIPHTGELKRGDYEYYTASGSKKEIYEYLDFTTSYSMPAEFNASALSAVLSGNKLLNKYSGYTLRDLRPVKGK